MEEADRSFFTRVAEGYEAIGAAEPQRVRQLDATGVVATTQAAIWNLVHPLLRH